jgi:hypothetical protein
MHKDLPACCCLDNVDDPTVSLQAECEHIETASPNAAVGWSTIGWSMSVERPREETAE